MGLVALVLWRLRDRFRPGILFAVYLVFAGIERFLVEFLRRNDEAALGLTQPQLLSIVMILAGAIWIGVVASRHGLAARPDDRYPFGPPAQPASA
jgi:phosphatidylglycerol:prolipoprotein diacylglycerol transferase